ncbi:glycogenin-1-like isoform X2 [Tachypleus tridentatus]|uniref:glycogenin-1-like isoform X2 n=1 Tax=Tachypleus tridentatus TaxID=6853 RepID=UPI003FD1F28E
MLLNIGLNLVDTVFCSIWRFLGCQRSDVASYQGDCVKEKYALADEAFVTLATDDSYSLGALVLGHSLRIVQTSRSLVILVTAGVTADMRSQLASVFDLVQEVDEIDSEDEANLAILTRPELGVTFTKIQCWKLTQFKKCVFLDADTLVLRNCDELFNREELSAVPDIGWPDCFNSGVFVFKPSDEMYKALVAFAKEKGSFDGGDQGLLNLFFQDWATKDISHHLSFLYNMNSNACYTYLPAFKKFGNEVKIVHFLGEMKPWMYKVSEGKIVKPRHSQYYCDHLQYWWDLFLSYVWPHQDIPSNDLDKVELKLPEERKTSAFQVHSMAVNLNSRQEAWEKGQIDYMGVDCFENIRKKLDSKIYGLK